MFSFAFSRDHEGVWNCDCQTSVDESGLLVNNGTYLGVPDNAISL